MKKNVNNNTKKIPKKCHREDRTQLKHLLLHDLLIHRTIEIDRKVGDGSVFEKEFLGYPRPGQIERIQNDLRHGMQ